MSYSDDDIVVIDSSSASDTDPACELAQLNSSPDSDEHVDAGDCDVRQPASSGPTTVSKVNAQRSTTYDVTCQKLHATVLSLSAGSVEVGTQTDANSSNECSNALYEHLMQLDTALGICASVPKSIPANSNVAIKKFIASWRQASGSLKRPRGGCLDTSQSHAEGKEREDGDKAEAAPAQTGAKQEDARLGGVVQTPSLLSTAPPWASELGAALEQCQRLLAATATTDKCRRESASSDESCRARLASAPVAPSQLLAELPSSASPRYTAATAPSAVRAERISGRDTDNRIDSTIGGNSPPTLLREAEVICACEHKSSLLPLYTELHALRRQHAQEQQRQAQTVSSDLQWEQRFLTDVLTECEAQLDFMHTNFLECCRGNLAPLDALQRRMQTLETFQRHLRAAEMTTAPVTSVPASNLTNYHTEKFTPSGADAVEHTLRPLGRAAETLTRHLEAELRRLQSDLDAARAQLKSQAQQNIDLQACYAHVTAQMQAAIDAEHFVDRAAITALKQQQREALAALATQFGWTLVNYTPDVLSLRHPRTGEVLHANHTYASINGKPCEDVAKALAEYVVRHAAAASSDTAQADTVVTAEVGEQHRPVNGTPSSPPPPPATGASASAFAEFEDAVLPPVPTSDEDEAEAEQNSDSAATKGSKETIGEKESLPPLPAASNNLFNAEGACVSIVKRGGENSSHRSASPSAEKANCAVNKYEEKTEAEEKVAASSGISVSEDGDEEQNDSSIVDDRNTGSQDVGTGKGTTENGEKQESVNLSNLQSTATTHSHSDNNSGVNLSVESAAAANAASDANDNKSEANVYTGFFTENALWEDDS